MIQSHYTRTRIAPTPSGFLHLGNLFSFALTASLARKTGASILLRIDDLDQQRIRPEYVQDIFDTLQFFHIPWQEGPHNYEEYAGSYSQTNRMHLYEKALNELRDKNQVFACSCSRAQVCECRHKHLSLDDPAHAWRLHTPATIALKDFIVKKKDGFPSYQLACVADDEYYGVDLIVRGDDLQASTEAQIYLAGVLGYTSFTNCSFLHHQLLMESGGQKLSKSAGSTSLQYLIKQGKSPAEIFAVIGRLAGMPTPVTDWQDLSHAIEFH